MAVKQSNARASAHPDTRPVPVAIVDPPHQNPRQDFDEAELASFADSISQVGLLEPVIVCPRGNRYELVAGERRLRAVQSLGWKEIPATIRELTDRQAAEIRLLENLDRKSLNPVEEATAFRMLQDLGHSLDSLAKLARLSQRNITNRLGLLQLPTWWQSRIRSGELTAAAAEYLLEWIDYPRILEAMEPVAKRWPMLLTDWYAALAREILLASRSMDPDAPDGPHFEPAYGQKVELDIHSLRLPRLPGSSKTERAMNVSLWDELQDLADFQEAQQKTADAEACHSIDTGRPQFAKPERPDGEPAEGKEPSRLPAIAEADSADRFEAWLTGWLRGIAHRHMDAMPARELRSLLRQLSIDVAGEWRLDREFLELHDDQVLKDLAAEWGVDLAGTRNRQEVIAVLLHVSPEGVPRIVEEMLGQRPAA